MAKSVEKKRLTLDLDAPLQRRLKAVAALKGVSMRQYCQTAIEKELAEDEGTGVSEETSGLSGVERLRQLQKDIFGDRVLPGDSVDIIREMREERDAQLDEALGWKARE